MCIWFCLLNPLSHSTLKWIQTKPQTVKHWPYELQTMCKNWLGLTPYSGQYSSLQHSVRQNIKYCIKHICRFHTLSCTTHLGKKIFWNKCNYLPCHLANSLQLYVTSFRDQLMGKIWLTINALTFTHYLLKRMVIKQQASFVP